MTKPVVVTQEDIDRGFPDMPAHCPLAHVLGRSNADAWDPVHDFVQDYVIWPWAIDDGKD